MRKRVDLLALSIYGLILFPKVIGYIEVAILELFDYLERGVIPIAAILAETFRSLNFFRKMGEGRFTGCVQLLTMWFTSHFWKVDKTPYRVFSDEYSPLQDFLKQSFQENISAEKWRDIFRDLKKRI